ncbi:hypothetical protein CSUI_003349, partial [Cystoisospora suis]
LAFSGDRETEESLLLSLTFFLKKGRSFFISCTRIVLVLSTFGVIGTSRVSASELAVGTQPRRLSTPTVPKCTFADKQQETLTVQLSAYSLEAKFDCGIETGNGNTADPDCAKAHDKCCDATAARCDLRISEVAGVNGSVSMEEASKIITVKLDDTPKEPQGKLYYKCASTSPNGTCIVTVNMPATLVERQCNFDKGVKLPTIAEPNKEEKFECGGTVKTPATDTQVFKAPDCSGEPAALSALVPGAKLTKGNDGIFTFSVAALPSDTQNLCFKCIYPDPRTAKPDATCAVTVTVSGASKTTTASTTSAAKGFALTSIAALVIAFFTTASVW